MGLLKGLMINQGPAEARIRPERGLAMPWPRVLCGCYSWATIKPYQASMGVSDEAGRRVVTPRADSDALRFPPISPYPILSAGTSMPAGHSPILAL